jgi:hypothetical protein
MTWRGANRWPHRQGANRSARPTRRKTFPVEKVRFYLEPGPTVLVSSEFRGNRNIMTMGWHMITGTRRRQPII